MGKIDWQEAGDQIRKLVQEAVDSRDFSQLSNTISDVVEQAVDGLQDVLQDDRIKEIISQTGRTNSEAAERIRQRMKEKRQSGEGQRAREPQPVKAVIKVPGEISGRVMKWYGFGMGSMTGIAMGVLGLIALTTGFNLALPVGILGLICGVHVGLGMGGNRRLQMAKRFRKYQEVICGRTHCLVEELADAVGKNIRFVQKDLRTMIVGGYFREGYLDRKGTMLITDKQTYQHYLAAQTEYEKRKLEKQYKDTVKDAVKDKEKEETVRQKREIPPECRELVAEGERYIQHVHECNERIPGEEMSAKLDRLEMVITRIFHEAEKNPDIVPELKKMMSYYLPTTRKLLDAYCELDLQPISGQNIENTKKEIEAALDTINAAFENLLDSLFEETAWDISSDISVLNTMLAQEGLTGTAFDRKQK